MAFSLFYVLQHRALTKALLKERQPQAGKLQSLPTNMFSQKYPSANAPTSSHAGTSSRRDHRPTTPAALAADSCSPAGPWGTSARD